MLLRNHGVIVYAEQIQDIIELYNQLKVIFEQNDFVYTPDDAVDKINGELWLFRNAMENIALKKQISLIPLKVDEIDKLLIYLMSNIEKNYRK